jgi:hypothetical protein
MKGKIVSADRIVQSIHSLRGQKVMLDLDLAKLYEVSTGHLNRAVKRNSDRFPADFMFRLRAERGPELEANLAFQAGVAVAVEQPLMPSPNKAWRCCRAFSRVTAP